MSAAFFCILFTLRATLLSGDTVKRFLCLFTIGGLGYNVIEWLWRGYSHWSMFFLGGTCFHVIGRIGERLRGRGALTVATACSAAVTAAEFLCGCLVNLRWKLNVWDYSRKFANLRGQVCLLYSVLWGCLSLFAVPLYRGVNRLLWRGSGH